MSLYVGLTIGPILDTISEATAPAALWFGSTLFSDLARRLRVGVEELAEEEGIYAPAFDEADRDQLTGGIGKYHDRIIFKSNKDEQELKRKLDELIAREKDRTLNMFGEKIYRDRGNEENKFKTFLHRYLQIHYVILPEDRVGDNNIILAISPYLDALELMGTFPADNANNPIARMMSKPGEKMSASYYIKGSELFRQIDSTGNQFVKSDTDRTSTIRDIEDIAFGMQDAKETKPEHKYQEYYAVVYADADGMGTFLQTLPNEYVPVFSDCCLKYSMEATRIIGDFKGMTIYAGGDDLLFLSPVKRESKTIFDICGEIAAKFEESLKALEDALKKDERFKEKLPTFPTVSFGISIQYKKYPLYEALEQARDLLFGKAKHFGGKNCMAIRLEKHSGQSVSFLVGNECASTFTTILNLPDQYVGPALLKSVGSALEEQYALISLMDKNVKEAESGAPVYSGWENLFDNGGQKAAQNFLRKLNETYYGELVRGQVRIEEAENKRPAWIKRNDKELNALLAILRLMRFFSEKSGREGAE